MSPLLFASASTTSLPLCRVRLLISIPWAEKNPFLIPRSIGSAFAIGSVATVTVASCFLPAVSRALAVAPPNSVAEVTATSAAARTVARRREPLPTRFISRPFCQLAGTRRRRRHRAEVRLYRLGGPQKPRKHLLPQVLHRHPARVDGDVHRCRYGPARVADRYGDRSDALLELLVYGGPPAAPNLIELGPELVDVRDGPRSERVHIRTGQAVLEPVGIERGEQHPAHRRRVGRQPRADRDRDRHDPAGRHADDVDDLGVVEDGDRRRLVHLRDQRLHVRLRQLGKAES